MLEYDQLKRESIETKDRLDETKDKLDKVGDDINEKTKIINEMEKNQEKFANQDAKINELKDTLNKKNNDIIDLKEIIKNLEKKSIEKLFKQKNIHENQIKELKNKLNDNNRLLTNKLMLFNNNARNTRKKDEKARTFAPPDNASMPPLEIEEEAAAENITDIYERRNTRKKDYTSDEEINLNDVDDLINEILEDKDMMHIINNKKNNNFKNLFDFINDIKYGNINNLNKEKAYKDRISEFENKIKKTPETFSIKLYKKYINKLKNTIFRYKTSKKEEIIELNEHGYKWL